MILKLSIIELRCSLCHQVGIVNGKTGLPPLLQRYLLVVRGIPLHGLHAFEVDLEQLVLAKHLTL